MLQNSPANEVTTTMHFLFRIICNNDNTDLAFQVRCTVHHKEHKGPSERLELNTTLLSFWSLLPTFTEQHKYHKENIFRSMLTIFISKNGKSTDYSRGAQILDVRLPGRLTLYGDVWYLWVLSKALDSGAQNSQMAPKFLENLCTFAVQ
jgi:hypothetical protein